MIKLTRIAKTGGPLTKWMGLGPDGSLVSDGSACVMAEGKAWRANCTLQEFANGIATLRSDEAIALGTLRHDLPDTVQITTKARLEKLNGVAAPSMIARTSEHILYQPEQPALVLLDGDTKGMPATVRSKLNAHGGFWPAIVSVLPELETAGRVVRASTSAGLYRTDTGDRLPGSDGCHIYVMATDGTDSERFLRRLHDRCWLHGLGWLMVGEGGQLLERSIVDRMVYAPERLVFEGAPILDEPLAQDQASRKPIWTDGPPIDTRAVCLDLKQVEQATLRRLKAADAHRLAPEADKARSRYIAEFAKRTGCSLAAARHTVERECNGVLLPIVALVFDSAEFEGATVGNVLADPDRFVGNTLADPLEGIAYGRCKARVMQRPDGSLWIHSFAHGRAAYDLKHDATTIEANLRAAPKEEAADRLVQLLLVADIAPDEEQHLRDVVCELSDVKPRPLGAKIKAARAEQEQRRAMAERNRRAAERTDPRAQIPVALPDAPWLPQMQTMNDVIAATTDSEPTARDIEGECTDLRMRAFPLMHMLSTTTTNPDDNRDRK